MAALAPEIAAAAAPEIEAAAPAIAAEAKSILPTFGQFVGGMTMGNKFFDQGKKMASNLFSIGKSVGRGLSRLFGGGHRHHSHSSPRRALPPPPPPPNGIERAAQN